MTHSLLSHVSPQLPLNMQHNGGLWLTAESHFPTEIRVSPTKPCGKGSKRKQDDLEDEEEDEDHPTWVEALTQELAEDVGPEEDPDYEVDWLKQFGVFFWK